MLFTGLALGLPLAFWSPMPSSVYEVTKAWGVTAMWILFLAGWVFALAGILHDSYPKFVGLRQACCHVRGLPCFAGGMTLFTLVGCYFVERSYVDRYGEAYRAVQATTPLLLPNWGQLWRRNGGAAPDELK